MRDHNAPQANGTNGGSGGSEGAAAADRVVHPLQQGVITDGDVLEACLDHVLYERVSCEGAVLRLPGPGLHCKQHAGTSSQSSPLYEVLP